jgi:FHS family L-fucose permease-like MFS transporter
MSVVGGRAIARPFMGYVAERHSLRIGFVVPPVCFVFVALYGFTWAKLGMFDSLPCAEEQK